MKFTPLTREQFAAMPEPMKAKRRAEFTRLVDNLGRDHYARYHGVTEARMAEWRTRREQLDRELSADAAARRKPYPTGVKRPRKDAA